MKLEESVTFFPHWLYPREVVAFTLMLKDIEILWLEGTFKEKSGIELKKNVIKTKWK